MVHKRNSRLELGRQTTFELCGREIDHDELVGRSGTTMADSISIPQLATTPPDVAYFTPPNTEPVMQLQTSALWLDGPFLDELSQLMEPEMFDVDLIDVDLNQDENEFWVGQMDWEENMLIWGSS